MKLRLDKYFGNWSFYKMIFAVALPIVLQNGITTFVGLLDNIMVGQTGTEQMSGVAIVNQLIFVFNLGIFGMISGAGIFSSQFHGKGDTNGVREAFRFKLIGGLIFTALAIAIFVFFDDELISLYLHDGSQEGDLELTLAYAKEYLNIILWTLVPFALSQIYGGTLRETEHAVLPMVAGLVAVAVNCVGNYILIFGKFGAPALGAKGAAIATLISRIVELLILIVAVLLKSDIYAFHTGAYAHLFKIDPILVKKIFQKGMPLFVNEMLWSIGVSALAQCYSVRGLAVVAGYNIANTISNTFNVSFLALGTAVGIIVGKYLGAKDFETAIDVDRKLITFSVCVGACMGILVVLTSKVFPQIYNTTDEVRAIATEILIVFGCVAPFRAFMNASYFTLRSGGKTLITFLYDSVFVCCVNFPVAFCVTHFTSLDILYVIIFTESVDFIKCILGYILLKKRVWLNQLV